MCSRGLEKHWNSTNMKGSDILVYLGVSEILMNYLTELLVVSCRLHKGVWYFLSPRTRTQIRRHHVFKGLGFQDFISQFLQLCTENLICELYGALSYKYAWYCVPENRLRTILRLYIVISPTKRFWGLILCSKLRFSCFYIFEHFFWSPICSISCHELLLHFLASFWVSYLFHILSWAAYTFLSYFFGLKVVPYPVMIFGFE